jgi:colanic acid biosynthesis glycosyl transferase WcaI
MAFAAGFSVRRPDLIVTMTDPPIIGAVGWTISVLRRVPLVVVVQDLHPDVGIVLGRFKHGVVSSLIDRLNRLVFGHACKVVAISESMKRRLLDKGVPSTRVAVISNWADTTAIAPEPKVNPFSLQYNLATEFVVMYSGNLGLTQNLDILIRAAGNLRAIEDVKFVIIGDGAKKVHLAKLAAELDLRNVLFLPYQPIETLRYSFAAADVFVVPLSRGMDGFVVPSKVFSIMASGRPFIASIEAASEVASIVREYECGVLVEPDDAESLAAAIRRLYHSKNELATMGARGRDAVVSAFSKETAAGKYQDLFQHVVTAHEELTAPRNFVIHQLLETNSDSPSTKSLPRAYDEPPSR